MLKQEKINLHRAAVKNDPEIDNSEQSDENDVGGNSGWADCMAKVLNTQKPKKKKVLVLSRAKRLTSVKVEKKQYDFEIEGEVKEEKPNKTELDTSIQKKTKKTPPVILRVKPTLTDREREKALKKIALRGTVQLFNAVRQQQKEIELQLDAAGPLDHRKDAVLNNINKRKFLDVLMSGERAKSVFVDNTVKKEEIKEESDEEDEKDSTKKKQWSVLRDDFMTNKKLKHWDQEDSDEAGPNCDDSDGNNISSDSD